MNPTILAAAAYLLLGQPGAAQPISPPPVPVVANCPSPDNMRPIHPQRQNHLTVRWVGDRDYYDRGRHHHRHHPRHGRFEDQP